MRREFGCYTVLLLALGLFGGFTWLTHHPETPWLEEAEAWPVVGELAQRFRLAYLGPQRAAGGAEEGAEVASAPSGRDETPEDEVLDIFIRPRGQSGRPAGQRQPSAPTPQPPPDKPISLEGLMPATPPSQPTIPRTKTPETKTPEPALPFLTRGKDWFLPGQPVFASPQATAAADHLTAMAYLPVLSREGSWAQVVYRDRSLWLDTAWEPPFPRGKARRGLVRHRAEPIRGNDWEKLKKARKVLGVEKPSRQIGPYQLLTDVEDEDLLDFLESTAAVTEKAYFARYGRLPAGNPNQSAVLFARREDYLRYSEGVALPSSRHAGHAGGGVLVFYAEGHSAERLGRTLVHEITHLLNARALSQQLPTWLAEGLATDLEDFWWEVPEGSEAFRRRSPYQFELTDGATSLLILEGLMKQNLMPPAEQLISLPREVFYREGIGHYNYAYSGALVRFFLEGDDGRHADAFRAFLHDIAIGHRPLPRQLLKHLDLQAAELDAAFRPWLAGEIRDLRSDLPADVNIDLGKL